MMDTIKSFVKEHKEYFALFGALVIALGIILIGILGLKLPAISVCIVVLLVAGMALCLQDLPIWLHGVVVAALAIVGIVFGKVWFLILSAVFYVVSILALSVWDK